MYLIELNNHYGNQLEALGFSACCPLTGNVSLLVISTTVNPLLSPPPLK